MSFRAIEKHLRAGTLMPAAIRLVQRRSGEKPRCLVVIRAEFAKTLDWKHGERIAAQIGEGADAGKLRLVRGGSPAIAVARFYDGRLNVHIGYVSSLNGGKKAPGVESDVARIDDDTLEVRLPDEWLAPAPRAHATKPASPEPAPPAKAAAIPRPTAPAPARLAPAPAAKSNGHKPAASVLAVTHNGITVNLDHDGQSIEYAGKVMELTARQAELLAMLTRASPFPIGRPHIVAKIWPNTAAATAESMLSPLAMRCGEIVTSVGLKVNMLRGVGIALQVKE